MLSLQIHRSKNRWKFYLKDGVMCYAGKEYVFSKAVGEAEWWDGGGSMTRNTLWYYFSVYITFLICLEILFKLLTLFFIFLLIQEIFFHNFVSCICDFCISRLYKNIYLPYTFKCINSLRCSKWLDGWFFFFFFLSLFKLNAQQRKLNWCLLFYLFILCCLIYDFTVKWNRF